MDTVNRPDNEIIYYTGHGAAPQPPGVPGEDALVPSYILNIGIGDIPEKTPEYVSKSDINDAKNARIVFLNSCYSMFYQSFANSFGTVNSVLIGWDKSIGYSESNDFADKWWDGFLSGMSALDAAKAADIRYVIRDSYPDMPKLTFHGDDTTHLDWTKDIKQ